MTRAVKLLSNVTLPRRDRPDRSKGSHRIFTHLESGTQVTISEHTGDDADHYQERELRRAIERIRQWKQERQE